MKKEYGLNLFWNKRFLYESFKLPHNDASMKSDQRKKFIAIASRRAKPGSGSGPLVLRERTETYGIPDLRFLVGRVKFVVVGGVATRLYMPERMTLDTDILVLPDDLARTEAALKRVPCKKLGPLAIGGSTWRMPGNRFLDVVALDEVWTEDAIQNSVQGKDGLPYIALPYLVLMKLTAGRVQDMADISRMLGSADDNTVKITRRLVSRYRSTDVEDLDSLVQLGKLEYKDSQKSR
ncbi:MAG TPA: hypothetical protein DCZ95_14580 [Verrucomicrobia bacterium]|nr:hypothetical protein [Verrucomicrobiota bacterium]